VRRYDLDEFDGFSYFQIFNTSTFIVNHKIRSKNVHP